MAKYIFNNYGSSYQMNIERPEDLQRIVELDEALWAATSLPVEILNIDKKFLAYLDMDNNNRIRTDEIKSAVSWLFNILNDHSGLGQKTEILFLNSINTEIPEGDILHKTARRILANLKVKDNTDKIELSQVRNLQGIMASSATNGDGVITPEDTGDPEISELIRLMMRTVGSSTDASGAEGINGAQAKEFFNEASLYLDWLEKGKIPEDAVKTDVMIWGTDTPAAFNALQNIEKKMDEFFAQCDIIKFDDRVKDSLQLSSKELQEEDFTKTEFILERLKSAPLAALNPEGRLPLDGYLNPLFIKKVEYLKDLVLTRIYGSQLRCLTKEQWNEAVKTFSSYRGYIEGKRGAKTQQINKEDLKKYTSGNFQNDINNLIEKDLAAAKQIQNIQNVEKLILFQKYLMEFSKNSASFANVYDPEIRSIFEAGTLVIDGRKIPFTILITDRNSHKKTAKDSNVYLMYVDVTSKHNGDKRFEVVAAVTSGDSGTMRIGKRGIFFTRDGKEWDAEVVDIVLNPIGLLESIKAPFIKISDTIKNHVEKFAKTREAKAETAIIDPSGASMARDLLVGGGVALAALGSSFAYVTKAVSQVRVIHFFITIGIILILILFPSLIMGIIRLRKRNLSILFEASGCAINVRMKLTVGLGRIFTYVPPYPYDSHKNRLDIIAQIAKNNGRFSQTGFRRILRITIKTVLMFILAFLAVMILFRIGQGL